MERFSVRLLVAALFASLVIGAAPISLAQEDTDTEEFILEEITVTAQKREENQQKVPIAMEVITGEDLTAMGKNNVDEILKDIPNALINTGADGMRISLRGITDDSNIQSNQRVSDSAVALNVDGSYNNMSNAGQNLFDIERVEVLMGPQSTMYGSNAPGGVVNVVTASPKTDKYSASASVEYGSYDLLSLQGVVNVPILQDRVGLRLAASKTQQDPFVDGDSESDSTSARLKILYEPYDKLSFEVTGNWSERGGGGMMGGSVKPFIDQDGYYPDGTKVTDPWTGAEEEEGENASDQTTKGLSASIDWETPLGNISAVPSYSKSESDSSGMRMGSYSVNEDSNEQKGGELRITNATSFEWFDWILGGTYYESEQSRYTAREGSNDTGQWTTSKKSAVYANITYPMWFNDQLRFTLGFRQSWDQNFSEELNDRGDSNTTGNPDRESNPDWKYGFEYDAADNLMIYGSFSSSYRMPNAMSMDESRPEELDSYSLGAKSRWLDNRLQVNLSVYYYDYANKLCSGYKVMKDIDETTLGGDYIGISEEEARGGPGGGDTRQGARGVELIEHGDGTYGDGAYPTMDTWEDLDKDGLTDTNGDGIVDDYFTFDINEANAQGYGAFTSIGIDLSTTFIITSKDRVNFSVSYLDAEWEDLTFEYDWFMIWGDENGMESYEGVTPVNAPKWSMTASYEHNFMLGAFGTLTPRFDAQYKSKYNLLWDSEYNDDTGVSKQEAYATYDASVAFNHSSDKWSLNAYAKNITDYAVKVSYMGQTGSEEMRLSDPRTFGATFSIKF